MLTFSVESFHSYFRCISFTADSTNPSPNQWTSLMNFLEPEPEMLGGLLTHPRGLNSLKKKWDTLATVVNAVPDATAQKTGPEWKNVS